MTTLKNCVISYLEMSGQSQRQMTKQKKQAIKKGNPNQSMQGCVLGSNHANEEMTDLAKQRQQMLVQVKCPAKYEADSELK
jgi:hypothetical protein